MFCKRMKMDEDYVNDNEVSSKNSMHINQLPESILLNIFSKLQYDELCLCSRVCQKWREIANDFTLKKKIILNFPISDRHFSNFIKYHFTEYLEEFQLLNPISAFRLLNPILSAVSPYALIERACFFSGLMKCEKIKKLVLASCSLLSFSIHDLPPSLIHLSTRDCELYPSTFFSMKPCHATQNLTCLELSGCNNFLTSADLHVLTAFKSLKALYFEGCYRINTGGMESLVDILPQLEVLDVEGTDISNEGIHIILDHCVNIRELFIGHTNIDDDALINHRKEKLPFLSHLCVKCTGLTISSLHTFFSRCPEEWGIKIEPEIICILPTNKPHYALKLENQFMFNQYSDPLSNANGESTVNSVSKRCTHYLSHKCFSSSKT